MEQASTIPTTSAEFLNANRSVDRETEEELFMLASHARDQGTSDSETVQLEEGKSEVKEEVENGLASQLSRKTIVQTTWSASLWTNWANQRKTRPHSDSEESKHELVADITAMRIEDLAFWLGKFIVEVRRQKDGKPYPVETLCNVVGGLNRTWKFSGKEDNFLKDPVFSCFREIYEKEKKRLRSASRNQGTVATESVRVPRFPRAVVPKKSPIIQEIAPSQQIKEVVSGMKWGEADATGVSGVAKKTLAQTAWCSRIWATWAKQRMDLPATDTEEMQHPLLTDFKSMSSSDMAFWLRKFILELRRTDGGTYSPESLSNILAGLSRLLKYSGRKDIDLMRDPAFSCCREVRDMVLCQLRSSGNYSKKSPTVIGPAEENILWEKGLLGDHNAHVLIDTLVYYFGRCFGIRSGHHRKLRHKPSQFELFEPPGAIPYLVYTEDASESNPQHTKLVLEMNTKNPRCCLVRLYKLYNSKCPENRPNDAFYLRPLVQPRGSIWYDIIPVGHNVLCGTIHRLFSSAGMKGHYTHNSPRVTSASRLYYPGLDEHHVASQVSAREVSSANVHSYNQAEKQCKEIPALLNIDPNLFNDASDITSEQGMVKSQITKPPGNFSEVKTGCNETQDSSGPDPLNNDIPCVRYSTEQSSYGPITNEPEIIYIGNPEGALEITDPDAEGMEDALEEVVVSNTVMNAAIPETASIEDFQQEQAEGDIVTNSADMETFEVDSMNQELLTSDGYGPNVAGASDAGIASSQSSISTHEASDELGNEYFISHTEEIEGSESNGEHDFNSPEPEEALPSDQFQNSEVYEPARFSAPVGSEDISESASHKSFATSHVPQRTIVQTAWCTGIWSTWAIQRQQRPSADSEEKQHELQPDITSMAADDIAFWLAKFILEIRRTDGKPYSSDSIYSIFAGLNRGLKYSGRQDVSLMRDPLFKKCRDVLEGEMARLHDSGQSSKKSAAVISAKEENILWEKGILGDHSPQSLVDTLVYYFGYYFSISGGEHRKLRHEPSQIQLFEPSGGVPYLVHTEDTTSGKLKRHKKRSVYMNVDDPERCLVRLYKLYVSKCPENRPKDAFYLRPMTEPKQEVWYEAIPLGHNYLSKTISRIFKSAGIEGNYNNLSLRGAKRAATPGSDEHTQLSNRSDKTSSSLSPVSRPVSAAPPMKRLKLLEKTMLEHESKKTKEKQAITPAAIEGDNIMAKVMQSSRDRHTDLETGLAASETGALETENPKFTIPQRDGNTASQTVRLEVGGQDTTASRNDRLGATIVAAVLRNFGLNMSGLESVACRSAESECTGKIGYKTTRKRARSNTDPKSLASGALRHRTTTDQCTTPSLDQESITGNDTEESYNSASDSIELNATPLGNTESHVSQADHSESHSSHQAWSNVGPDALPTILRHNGPPIIITGGLTINFNFK